MSAREQAIEAGARALESGDFDYYPCDHGTYMQSCADCLAAAVVDAVEPIVRADERERLRGEMVEWRKEHEVEVRERLRAQVDDLRQEAALYYEQSDYTDAMAWCRTEAMGDVLALLDGELNG